MIGPDDLSREFEAAFGRVPRLYRAPGRVNLIGEHTDYNDGFVLPMALDRSTWVAAAPRDDGTLVVRSREYGETVAIDLAQGAADPRVGPEADSRIRPAWSRYVRGVAAVLNGDPERVAPHTCGGVPHTSGEPRDAADVGRPFQGRREREVQRLPQGRPVGAEMLIASDVPIGAGLSSSAALEVACAFALADLAGASMDLDAIALACQRAEHEFAGTRCGVMDQMIACHARAGHAMLLDTRSLSRTFVPVPPAVRVVVCNTMVAHALASAEYNARRSDCEAGVAALARRRQAVRALRDATLDDLRAVADDVPARVWRRCRHVITENDRVMQAITAFSRADFAAVGALMAASHASLRDDYEVSCAELDAMVSVVSSLDGVFGARMTGGGFGGCAVALVDAEAVTDALQQTIQERYTAQTGMRPDVWVCAAGDGAACVPAVPFASLP